MRTRYDRQLADLRERTLQLGSLVNENILRTARALRSLDWAAAEDLVAADRTVNDLRFGLRRDGLTLIARQAPLARDLRLIETAIEFADELERIHDHVKGAALLILRRQPTSPLPDVAEWTATMADLTHNMLNQALKAYADDDQALARQVVTMDDAVDQHYRDVYTAVMAYFGAHNTGIHEANDLQFLARNFERMADRVSNLCEWVVYDRTGQYEEFDVEQEAPPPYGRAPESPDDER